ncbi:hypothetical protein Ga0466249_002801 [Sporomusaceae bacterium BoRhaA]|uniref:hypothetical protein n=1 Tax=Pelorhabdus rhamnosifermentans TaxID=2772457 RepID=UPI001C060F2F|nr:hypothetical protein [Pelorhabdus rhamnosifermentans]MBU2701682.1 hypothetical protein [Pelorhabdus rhamnosifermentans]
MSFKDVLAADIGKVFLNVDEFAEHHAIDGEVFLCVLDEDKSSNNKVDGVYNMRRRLFISKSSLGYRPEPEQKMEIDDDYYYVLDCIGNDMLEVVLEARQT